MYTPKSFTVSEQSARALLAAWNAADAGRLREAIAAVSFIENAPRASSEVERLEMIQEIASTIRQWMNGGTSRTDLDASIGLLRHLAGQQMFISPEAVRFETLASAPH